MLDSNISSEAEDWILNVYAVALESIAKTFLDWTRGETQSTADKFAGAVVARLAAKSITVEKLE